MSSISWSRKIQKEFDRIYSQKMQQFINFYPDVEDDESYQWVFKIDEDSTDKHRWTIDKATGQITKTIQRNQF